MAHTVADGSITISDNFRSAKSVKYASAFTVRSAAVRFSVGFQFARARSESNRASSAIPPSHCADSPTLWCQSMDALREAGDRSFIRFQETLLFVAVHGTVSDFTVSDADSGALTSALVVQRKSISLELCVQELPINVEKLGRFRPITRTPLERAPNQHFL